jgi:hypothetical protein
VSAPVGIHPQTSVPKGKKPTWIGQAPSAGPLSCDVRMGADWGFRVELFGCPWGRGFSIECPAERTQRSAPPRRWFRSPSARCSDGRGLGLRSERFGCPAGRGFSDERPAGRTQRSALSRCWFRALSAQWVSCNLERKRRLALPECGATIQSDAG